MWDAAAIPACIPSGVPGLDEILSGGMPGGAISLISGPPGSGKTTIALQILLNAAQQGEVCLFVSNTETEEQLNICSRLPWMARGSAS